MLLKYYNFFASKNNEVIVLERNSSPLKKLLLTGNGKCNYFNDNQDIKNYNSSNLDLINQIINQTIKYEIKNNKLIRQNSINKTNQGPNCKKWKMSN